MEEEDDLDAVYEDDVLEIISLSDEEGEHRIEGRSDCFLLGR